MERIKLYEELEASLGSKLLTCVLFNGPAPDQTVIGDAVVEVIAEHLSRMGRVDRICLFLRTRGGQLMIARGFVNLIREYCDELCVIAPDKLRSAGTLMAVLADSVVMTQQAELGPVDPSKNSVSFEEITGYFDFAKNNLAIKDSRYLTDILIGLSDKIHPQIIGELYRSHVQMETVVMRALNRYISDKDVARHTASFLCGAAGSHDYVIRRQEAKELGLNVRMPEPRVETLIQALYNNIHSDLVLRGGPPCGLIRSTAGGEHYYSLEKKRWLNV